MSVLLLEGLCYFVSDLVISVVHSDSSIQPLVILVGGLAGVFGSLVDSLLGASVQYSGYSRVLKKVIYFLIFFSYC